MTTYTDEQIAEACAKYVDAWDMETLTRYAEEQIYAYFSGRTVDAEELQNFMEENS